MSLGPTPRGLPVVRVFVAWGPDRSLAAIAVIVFLLTLAWAAVTSWPGSSPGLSWIADTHVYRAAGERLNAGHPLYDYEPGDRQLTVDPFRFVGPLLSPPLIAAIWRPLALLPFEPIVFAWWLAGLAVCAGTVLWLVLRGGAPVAIGVLLLVIPLAFTAWSGNVQAFLTPLIAFTWIALERGRLRLAGAAIGVATVLKLSPAFLGWWLLTTRRWSAFRAALAAGMVALALGVLGAGPSAYLDYLDVARTVSRFGGTEASLTGILRAAGASEEVRALVTPIVSVIGVFVIAALRGRPRAGFAAAIVTGVLASTVMNLTNVSLLLAAFVPFARWVPATSPATAGPGAFDAAEGVGGIDRDGPPQ